MNLKIQQKGKRTENKKNGTVSLKSLDFNAPEKTTKRKNNEKQKNESVSLKPLDFNAPEKTTKRKKKRKTKNWISGIEISGFQCT